MNWVWGWNKINRPLSSAVITSFSITLQQSKLDGLASNKVLFVNCLVITIIIYYRILALNKTIFLHRVSHCGIGGCRVSTSWIYPQRNSLCGKKTHICSTVERILNNCKLLASFTTLVSRELFNHLTELLYLWTLPISSVENAGWLLLLIVWKIFSIHLKCMVLNHE